METLELTSVTYDQALFLKKWGMPQETDSWYYYDVEGNLVPQLLYLHKGRHAEYSCNAPSQELAVKWLRDNKNILIKVEPHGADWWYSISYLVTEEAYGTFWKPMFVSFDTEVRSTYEEALTDGINRVIAEQIKSNEKPQSTYDVAKELAMQSNSGSTPNDFSYRDGYVDGYCQAAEQIREQINSKL